MSRAILSVLVLGLIVIAGIFFLSGNNNLINPDLDMNQNPTDAVGGAPPNQVSPTPTDQLGTQIIPLRSVSGSGVSQNGTAILTEEDGRVRVVLTLNQAEGLANQPAHIHVGSCPGVGQIAYPLNNVVDGQSETILNTTLARLQEQLPLAINVHKSESELDVYTSCGELSL